MSRRLLLLLSVFLLTAVIQSDSDNWRNGMSSTPETERVIRDSVRHRFSTFSDAELCQSFEEFHESDQSKYYGEDLLDKYLTEMTRRGGAIIAEHLRKKIGSLRQKHEEVVGDAKEEESDDQHELFKKMSILKRRMERIERSARNLELVTALNRIQKKPDPLQVVVHGPQELTREFPGLPALDVTIKNVDPEQREIGFQESGDYRSGRQARWRIEASDATGRVQPLKKLHGFSDAGGLFRQTTLKPGEGWQTTLNMASFVETLQPGEYRIRVLYHNRLTIMDWESVADLIVCQSEPIKLTVKRRSIPLTKMQQQEIRELLARFDDRQACKIIQGKYGQWAHEFIDPKSDYGRLLTLGWLAVPTLIEELELQGQVPERRAHLLSLLFSITGENNPRSPTPFGFGESTSLGTYSILEQGWSVSSSRTGEDEPSSSGFGFTSGPSTYTAKLDAKVQTRLIERWQKFKPHYEVMTLD